MVKLQLESTSEPGGRRASRQLVGGLQALASRNYTLLDQQAVAIPTCPETQNGRKVRLRGFFRVKVAERMGFEVLSS